MVRRVRYTSLGWAALAAIALALAGPSPARAGLVPTATPSRVVLTPTAKSGTSQAVTWRTDAATTGGAVQIAPADDGDEVITVPSTPGEPVFFIGWQYQSRHHSAVITGLSPGTSYRYRVGGGQAWSGWSTFTTPTADPQPWSMLYFGDAQNDLREKWAPVVRQSFATVPDAEVMVHAGDLINWADRDQEWTDWFDALAGRSTTLNTVATPGNHEQYGDPAMRQFTEHFSNPLNGPVNNRETAYVADYRGVRFISLNSNSLTPFDQVGFLEDALAGNPNRWSVVTFHAPLFSAANNRDNPHLRTFWLPILERHNVDLVMQGHDHAYSRGHVARNENGRPGQSTGPVYAVSVSGPKYYEIPPDGANNWTANGAVRVAAYQHTSTFQQIHVEENRLSYRAIIAAKGPKTNARGAVGETLDAFTIRKGPEGSKLVTEGAVFPPPAAPPPPDDR